MLLDWLALIGGTFGALLPIANPFSTAPVFVAITRDMASNRRNHQARMAAIYTAAVLIGALVAGAIVLEFFGISIPALRVAGGLIVAKVGFGMLNPAPEEALPEESAEEALHMRDIAFTPIAMPLLSGPGSIAVTITMATEVERPREYLAVALGIVLVAAVSWLILRSSTRVTRFLGTTGMTALTRLMGFLLVCIGVQFVALGLVEAVTHPAVAEAVMEAYRKAVSGPGP
jgi:multiple antibiotic resistance protein